MLSPNLIANLMLPALQHEHKGQENDLPMCPEVFIPISSFSFAAFHHQLVSLFRDPVSHDHGRVWVDGSLPVLGVCNRI